jgi:ABC-type polysaccharide transport system, permease component
MALININSVYSSLPFSKRRYKNIFPLLCMTVPFFLLVVIFAYVPLWGWSFAFTDFQPGISIFASKFVGLKNFLRLFDISYGSEFPMVMRNTLALSFIGIATMPIPVAFAIMITELRTRWLKRLIQTVTSFPYFVSWIIVYSLFFAFLSVDDGLINQVLLKVHLISNPTDILANPDVTWLFQTFLGLWKTAGYSAIIYISSIAGIDQELYKAAEIDGAGRFGKIRHITIPGIMPTFSVIMVLTIGNILNMGFDQYFVFHNPLIHERIEVLDLYTYHMGIINSDYPFATAVGIFKTVVSAVLLFSANMINKKINGKSII